jgi:hypothetical protein
MLTGRQGLPSSLTVNAAEQTPCEALFGDGVRKVKPHMLIEEPHGRGADPIGVSIYLKANGHLSASEPMALHCPSSALDRICVNARGRPHRSLGLGRKFVRLAGGWDWAA